MADSRIGIEVEGLDELRKSFAAGANRRELDKGLRSSHKEIAKTVEVSAKVGAATGTRQQRAAIRALLGRGTPTSAMVTIRNSRAVPFGIGAFMGAVVHKQFPEWVGTSWDLAAGDGPYVVAEAIAEDLDRIASTYESGILKTLDGLGLPVA